MHCQICKKNEATIHLTEINDGLRTEMHLCEHCAQEEGIAVKSQLSINELLANLLATQPSDEELFGDSDRKTCCPNCGFTLDQFTKEALLGCPNDYEVFEKSDKDEEWLEIGRFESKSHFKKVLARGDKDPRIPELYKKFCSIVEIKKNPVLTKEFIQKI